MRANQVLAERHRVVLGGWPLSGAAAAGDARVASIGALFSHCAKAVGGLLYILCQIYVRSISLLFSIDILQSPRPPGLQFGTPFNSP